MKILVADDEPAMVDFLLGCLSRAGFQVRGVGNAEEVIDCISAWCPDVVITDVQMRKGGARRVLQFMGEQDVATPVFLMTGGERVWAHQAVKQGKAVGVLENPLVIRAVLDAIATLNGITDH